MPDFTEGKIHVDYSQMNNAATDMAQQTKTIAGILVNLETELQQLKQSWEGDDRTVYSEKQAAWNHAVEEMKRMLAKNSSVLTEISDSYQYSEKSLSQLWSNVRIGG